MGTLIFYEKPGCATNSRQKVLLQRAGVQFEVRSLLAEKWTTDRLEKFFGSLPVGQWFNRVAPRIKSGDVRPDRISAAQALALMVADPLLIRRPLLQQGAWHYVGFVWEEIAPQLGIDADSNSKSMREDRAEREDMEACSHGAHAHAKSCAAPEIAP